MTRWRQPLGTISVIASGVQLSIDAGDSTNEKITLDMENIIDNTKYLSQTIEDFRNFFNNNEKNLSTSLSEFLEKSVSLTSATFRNNYIKVVTDISKDLTITGDKNQLIQAIINILNNAKDALKEKNQNKKCVFIVTAKKENNCVLISIKDNAGGVPEDIIDKIFDPYFTTKEKDKGTGLGLYISKEIITKNFKGSLEVKNEDFKFEGEKYRGANFITTIPI